MLEKNGSRQHLQTCVERTSSHATDNLSFSLSFSRLPFDDRSSLFAFREVSLNEFQARHACFLSFPPRSAVARRGTQENKLFRHEEYREHLLQFLSRSDAVESPTTGRGSVNTKRTGQQHWKMARVTRSTLTTLVRLAFFPSFARNDRESFARCYRFRCATAVPRPVVRRDRQR